MSTPEDKQQIREKIKQCFIKNNMCDCGSEHTELSIDETEYFDVYAVVKDLETLIKEALNKQLDELEKNWTIHEVVKIPLSAINEMRKEI